jgi:hypothetical protein
MLEGTDLCVICANIPVKEKEELRLIPLCLVATTVSGAVFLCLYKFWHNHIYHNVGRGFFCGPTSFAATIWIPELAWHVPAVQITGAMKKYWVPAECGNLFLFTLLAFE